MTSKGKAVIGSSQQTGEDRARTAAHAALHSPLMEDINLKHSDNILINITGTRGGVKMEEIYQVSETVKRRCNRTPAKCSPASSLTTT